MNPLTGAIASELDDQVGQLAEEFLSRLAKGEKPTAAEYAERHPELAEIIQRAFPALEIMGETQAHAPASASTGDVHHGVLGDYQIVREVGRGGMGVVYEAEQISLARRVALKVLPFAAVLDQRQITRFRNEARAAAQLKHPNIVQVFGVGCERSIHFYAMEFVEGQTFEQVIDDLRRIEGIDSGEPSDASLAGVISNRHASISPDASDDVGQQAGSGTAATPLSNGSSTNSSKYFRGIARIVMHVAEALDHAHQEGIVHRDVKPSNLMIDASGKPWVTDFGLARIEADAGMTMTGDLLGTLRYMSPEQTLANRVVVDHRTDIYSLGVTLYELITLRTAFPQDDRHELMRHIAFEDPPHPRQINRRIPAEMETIVMTAMQKRPDERFYATAQEMADDLRRFVDGEPVRVRPPGLIESSIRWARRRRRVLAVAASAILLAAATGFCALAFSYSRVAAERDRAKEQTELADQARLDERRLNFRHAVDRGLTLCDEGHVGSGMLWLAHALEIAPQDDSATIRAVRANLNAWRRELHSLQAIYPHEHMVSAVSVSPDGKLVITGTVDGQVQVWEQRNGKPRGPSLRHSGQVHEVPFSPDGSHFLTASYDNTACLWETNSRNLVRTFRHNSTVYGATFLPDGRIVTSTAGGWVRIWDPDHGETAVWEQRLADHAIHDIALGPDGKTIVAAWHSGGVVVWDLEEEKFIARFAEHSGRVATAAFIGTNRIASGDTDGNVILWEWANIKGTARGKVFGKQYQHFGGVHRLRLAGGGKYIATASFDNDAQFLDVATGDPVGMPLEHQGALQSIALNKRGNALTACGDGYAREWLRAPGTLDRLYYHQKSVQPTIYTDDARYLIIKRADGTATVHHALTGERIGKSIRPVGGISSLAVSPDQTSVLTGSVQGLVQFWNAASGEPYGQTYDHGGATAWTVLFGPHGRRAYSGGLDGVVQDWDVATGTPDGDPLFKLPDFSVRGVALSSDGSRVAVATTREAIIIDAMTGRELGRLLGHKDEVASISFSAPDGRRLVTGGWDNMALVYDLDTQRPISKPMKHRGPIWYGVAFNADASSIVTACDDRTARVWDVQTGLPIGPRMHHEATLRATAFIRDDAQLLTGTAKGVTRTWNLAISPLAAEVDQIKLWLEVQTGVELDGGAGDIRELSADEWRERRSKLEQRGEPN